MVVGYAVAVSVLAVGVILVSHTNREATALKFFFTVNAHHEINRRGGLRLDVDVNDGRPVFIFKRGTPCGAGGLGNNREADGVSDVTFVDEVNGETNFGAGTAGLVGRWRVDVQSVDRSDGDPEVNRVVSRPARFWQDAEGDDLLDGQCIGGHTHGYADGGCFFVAVFGANGNR